MMFYFARDSILDGEGNAMETRRAERARAMVRVQVRQYALAYFRRRIAPWRWTKEEAEADALRRGDASRDQRSKAVYLTVPADILERKVWVERPTTDDDSFPASPYPPLRLVK